MSTLAERLAAIGGELDDPHRGLPEELFLFISRLTPLVNVDLLIKDAQGQILLTWRDDGYDGPGWHIPGGIVRYKESLAQRIAQVAHLELGATVSHAAAPLALHEIVHPTRPARGHFISLLYPCTLTSALDSDRAHRGGVPQAGAWAWFASCPDDLIPVHDIYRSYL